MTDTITLQSINDEKKLAEECLFQARRLCVDIRNNGRFLDQKTIKADDFLTRTCKNYMPLTMRCQECRDRKSAVGYIKTANAASLQPIRFSDWTAVSAHEAACYLLQDVLFHYGDIMGWDERGDERGKPLSELEKQAACKQLVQWTNAVSDKFIEEIQTRIEIENIGAHRWVSERTPDSKKDNKKKSLPDNPKLFKLAKKIKTDLPKGGTKIDIIRDFTDGDEKEAKSLDRQLRRYPHLLE